ncbi:ATP-binding cassette domain-containing protein [Leptotrichia hongkongensis]|uniref:ATP-binding cassette domain-containing protein n=1 Tax=Leptotrichia hongkongensis TaxID=554406 RepID=A0ABV4S3S9_9FUSO
MVELKDIKKNYTNFDLKINLKINKGEIFGLIGQSGSGKSTILRIIKGILKADKGEINIANNTEVAYIFQEFNLLYNKNVFDNVALPLILKKKFSAKKVEEVLKFVGLSDKKKSFIASLSGGERQRVAIARALVTKPQLLLCDEVTASLDKSVKDEILDLFEEINKKYGTTILVVTHELEVVKRLCSRVAIIEKGKITDIFNVNQKDYEKSNKSYADYVREVLK